MASSADEKSISKHAVEARGSDPSLRGGVFVDDNESQEVFKASADGVDFRTITWQRLIIILLKVQVATGVLSIPGAFVSLGAVPGAICVVGWQAINTCMSTISVAHIEPLRASILTPSSNRHSMSSHRLPQQTPPLPQ